MPDEIKPKWKTFAAEQLLTEWDPNLSAEQVFDLIVDSPDEDLKDNIDDHAVLIRCIVHRRDRRSQVSYRIIEDLLQDQRRDRRTE